MISVIVCSKDGKAREDHKPNIRKTIGAPYEYICIDNSAGTLSLAGAYNQGIAKAIGEILVFMHEDAFLMSMDWGRVLLDKFRSRPNLGLVGVAGTQYLDASPPLWGRAGRPFIKGRVVHELGKGEKFLLTVFSTEEFDTEVVAVDGVFMAVRAECLKASRFDDATFDGFHFYDLDLCMQVRRTHQLIVTTDLLIKHLSGGSFNQTWAKYAARFIGKYKSELPASCATQVPDFNNIVQFETVDIKGRVSQQTLK